MVDVGTARPGAIRLGRVLGVPVELSPSWFLLAGLVVLSYGPALADPGQDRVGNGYLTAAVFAVLLLLSVLLHELGHCVTARLFRLRVRRISVSFLAGLTEIVDPPQTPARAGVVSLAGPAVSVLLTGVGALAGQATQDGSAAHAVAVLFTLSNGALSVFNLLPGLPLDGGGALRALVWRLTGSAATATVVAAQAGRVLAVAVLPLAVLGAVPLLDVRWSPVSIVVLGLVAAFLCGGATTALRAARLDQRMSGLVAATLARPALAVPAGTPLAEALRRAHEAGVHALVVVDGAGVAQAVVSEAAVVAVPEHRRAWITVREVSRPLSEGLLLDPDLSGDALLAALRRTPAAEYVVRGTRPQVLVAADLVRRAGG